MHRTISYIVLFVVMLLLQIFLFDNLSLSIYFNPLIYIAIIVLLPLETPQIATLATGLGTGICMDLLMGTAGLNTIATLFVSFFRQTTLTLTLHQDEARERGVPSPERMNARSFLIYLVSLVLLHHIIFFSLETLSTAHLLHTLVRIIVSSAASVFFLWYVTRIFTTKFSSGL